MGGGVSKKTEQAQQNLATAQTNAATEYTQLAKDSLGKMDKLTAPATNYYGNLVSKAEKGNYAGEVQAAGPVIGNISQQFDSAKRNILDTVPAGPGQTAALAQLPAQQSQATATELNKAFTGGLGELANIGGAYGGVGISSGNLGLTGFQGAASTTGQVASEQAQGKANTLGFVGSLVGAAGEAAGGQAFGHL